MTTTERPIPAILDEEACRGFQSAIELAGRRWTGAILLAISRGSQRFGQIINFVDGLSDRLLSQRIKELESEGLIVRTVVPAMPAYSLYSLSARGRSLIAALQPLVAWGVKEQGVKEQGVKQPGGGKPTPRS